MSYESRRGGFSDELWAMSYESVEGIHSSYFVFNSYSLFGHLNIMVNGKEAAAKDEAVVILHTV